MNKRGVIRALVVLLIAACAAGISLRAVYRHRKAAQNEVVTETLGSPELPLMWIRLGEHSVNPMYGYREEQNLAARRSSLTLLTADRTFGVQIAPYGKAVTSVTYEITSLIDGAFVENGTVSSLTELDGTYMADIAVTTPILMDQEYAIRFTVTTEDEDERQDTVYYYTRLVQKTGTNLDAYLAFAEHFYRSCITRDDNAAIASYLESDPTPSRSSYAEVSIRSSLDQVTWGDLSPELYVEAIPEIKEINVETASFVFDYIISSVDKDGKTEYYNVHDFYRVRTNQGEILLIDMDRSTEQVFDAERSIYVDKELNLGVRSTDLQYVVSSGQERLAFVSGSDLWLYGHDDDDPATCIFDFRGENDPDHRSENRNSHIRICHVSDDGEVSFVVYGYMAAGHHEGTCGLAAYHYSEAENQLEEKLFIDSALDPEVLSYFVDKLAFINKSGQMFLYTGSQVLQIDSETGESSVVQDDVDDACFAVSDDQKYIAWMNEMEPYGSTGLTVLGTEDGSTHMITAPAGEKIRIIGFFNEDIVYGLARDEDIVTDAVGNRTFGMYELRIEQMDGTVLKTYTNSDSFVTETWWEAGDLEMVLSKRSGDSYVPSGDDHIINNQKKSENAILPDQESNKRCGLQVVLPFEVSMKAGSHTRNAELVVSDEKTNVVLDVPESKDEQYFVYASGQLTDIVHDTNAALKTADDRRGIVVDSAQKYVYERGNWSGGNMLDLEKIPQDLLVPPMDAAAIQEIIGDEYAVLNYSGCSVESIRYQLSRGYAVAAKLSGKQDVLLVGYDIFDNLWYYDPEKKEAKAIGSDDAAEKFGKQGNLFVSYYKL